MREYIRDFRMFAGRTAFITTMWGLLIAVCLDTALLTVWSVTENEIVREFLGGFIPVFTLVTPIIGFIPCNTLFTYNRAVTPGYKFFHSLPDASVRFRRAIVASSVYSLVIVLLWSALLLVWIPTMAVFSVFFGLTLKGAQNFFGHARSLAAMFVPMMSVIFAISFFMGFMEGVMDEGVQGLIANPRDALPLAAAGAAIFVIGTVYCAAVAEKKWRREV